MAERESPAVVSGSMLIVVLVLAGAVGLVFFSQRDQLPKEQKSQQSYLGELPAEWTIADLDGNKVQARDFRGKIVFLNVWATWCGPCIQEMPSIEDLYKPLKGSEFVFVIVSEEPAEKVKAFVQEKKWSVPMYVAPRGLPPVLQTDGIPATFIINRRGEISFKHVGSNDWNTNATRALLRQTS